MIVWRKVPLHRRTWAHFGYVHSYNRRFTDYNLDCLNQWRVIGAQPRLFDLQTEGR